MHVDYGVFRKVQKKSKCLCIMIVCACPSRDMDVEYMCLKCVEAGLYSVRRADRRHSTGEATRFVTCTFCWYVYLFLFLDNVMYDSHVGCEIRAKEG
ncbi:hypothetical protein COCSADRAFT_233105 [Bipolaris sorokiniana ND90Pr]|uniref:Uncharacterized protein n=1 Tax=Cochliobolus sativus (strain ND90Pr / ATCC 201652) TaxID=665912 RepID=M2S361_COCSN|nr:uncharacterized protein COCSADRAFT_233105 [Bipolaris sorokiniana ND90Pr]EMD61603.1 hypothetical protein COCSADRAFT_233105 [Bipolaris sorokiniana ND90Pr]